MTVKAPNNTWAARAGQRPQPLPVYSQAEWRERRRKRLITEQLSGGFSPSREIANVAGPFADRLTTLWGPLRFRPLVFAYADAAHEFVSTVIGWAAEADGRAKTTHLAHEPGKRTNAIRLIKDLAQRPEPPDITDEMIVDGSWAAALTAMPAAASVEGLRVAATYSDRLEKLLRDTVDRAAVALERKLAWAESQPPPSSSAKVPADQARAELAALGVQIS